MIKLLALFAVVVMVVAARNPAIGQEATIGNIGSAEDVEQIVAKRPSSQLVPGETIPNSNPDSIQAIERILAASDPGVTLQEEPFGDLMTRLNSIGIPVLIHHSAIDDELDKQTQVSSVGLPDLPLYWQLTFVLEKFNACMQLRDGYILVISKDVEEDAEFFVTITYDVSSLASFEGHKALADVIAQSVSPANWAATGTGEQTIAFSQVNGHTLMSVSAPWAEHLNVRKFLTQLTQLSSAEMPEGTAAKNSDGTGNQFASCSAEIQQARAETQKNLGGGAFKIDDR